MRLSRCRALAAAAAILTTFAGCASGDSDTDGDAGGKTFVLALSADPGALDPSLGISSPLLWVSRFAYDPLVTADVQGEIHSGLASAWEQPEDRLVFTIKDGGVNFY